MEKRQVAHFQRKRRGNFREPTPGECYVAKQRVCGKSRVSGRPLGDSPLPTTATNLTGAIQELHTSISTKATTAKANANAAGVAANADNIDDLRAALEAAEATDATNHTIAIQAVNTEASRAAAKEAANAGAIAAETARALAAEEQLRLSIQGGSGSTDLLSARVTALEGSLAALQTFISNQRTLIVANRQDMRGVDLSVFTEIIVLRLAERWSFPPPKRSRFEPKPTRLENHGRSPFATMETLRFLRPSPSTFAPTSRTCSPA